MMNRITFKRKLMKPLLNAVVRSAQASLLTAGLLFSSNLVLAQSQAQPPLEKGVVRADTNAKISNTTKHYWYDGDQRRELTIDSNSVARFALGEKAVIVDRSISNASAPLNEKSVSQNESPLLIDGGLKRALPGGVVVTLARTMPDDQAIAALRAAGLEPIRALMDSRVWLVASAPGLASLELANKIHESKLFAGSQPNWWTQKSKK